ncbi:MAG TPA: amino acid adenylation domain-containing protein, partial [Pseudomonadales bacterium]
MNLTELLQLLRQNNIRLSLENDQLKVNAAKGSVTPDIMALLKDNKQQLLDWAREQQQRLDMQQAIPARDNRQPAPLSFAQQRLWFIDQLAPGNITYNVPAALILRGQLDIDILQQVVRLLLQRHESLRSYFVTDNGEARQCVAEDVSLAIHSEATGLSLDDREALLQLAAAELATPFDLAHAPLWRLRLLRLADQDQQPCHLLLLNLHHIITDGWSNGILMREIAFCYQALAEGKTADLPALPVQYADYALWQQQQLPPARLAGMTRYWREQLAGVPALELATDFPRPPRKSGRGRTLHFAIGADTAGKLAGLARSRGCTPFVVLLAAWQGLLHRYTGQQDICVGTPVANRSRAELHGVIGFFVNTLALRLDLSGKPSFSELVQRANQVMLDASEHQDVPFESIVDALGISRDMSTTPVFQAAISYQKDQRAQATHVAGLAIEPLEVDTGTAKFDITLGISDSDSGYQCLLEYDSDLFSAARIERMARHFATLLQAACEHPQQSIATLPILTDAELRQFTEQWHGHRRPFNKHIALAAQIEQWAGQTPDKLAVDFPQGQLSYREFDRQASRLAHYLAANGFARGDAVALCIQRSPAMLVGLFAALKAGGCYIPIDPQYPADRIRYMLDDSQPRFVFALDADCERLATDTGHAIAGIESTLAAASDYPDHWRSDADNRNGEDLAYIMYTSGSTGQPKGVMMPQRGVCRLALNTSFVDVSTDDNIAHMCNIAFDATAFEIWTALLNGCTLVGITPETVLDPEAFAARIADKNVTIMVMTTALFNLYVSSNADMFANVRYLFVGGEALDPNRVRELLRASKPAHLMNGYGPTENACFTACHDIRELDDQAATVPLGLPVSNNSCYVVDANMQLLPVGVPGELCASGEGIALGYLNKPEQTAAAFVANPFPHAIGDTLYRTGDICRWREDGTLDMIGRVDDQVKIRGFRIEPGEIANQLGLLPAVSDCAVVVRQNPAGDKYLAAYIVPQQPAAEAESLIGELREALADSLPHYMVPQAWSLLQQLPMTANGKLDKKALPEPALLLSGEHEYVAARNELEQQIATVWQEVLEQPAIGVFANFFEAGGHSLLATRVVARLREKLDVPLTIADLFENPSIAELALHVQFLQAHNNKLPPLQPMARPQQLPLSFAQQRLWFIEQLEPGNTVYHMPFALRLRGTLDVAALQQAWQALLQRHETLRTRIVSSNGLACQHIDDDAANNPLPFYTVDDDDNELLGRASEFLLTPFDLARGPLIRAELLQQQQRHDYVLLLCMHHIISDGWSMDILLRDLLALYRHFSDGAPVLPPLPVQYADYTLWQQQWLQGDILAQQIDFWRERLAGSEILQLPCDYSRPPRLDNRGAQFSFTLPEKLSGDLRRLAGEQQATLFMLGLAAFSLLMSRYSNQQDISIGTPVANRPQSALQSMIGLFINTLVMRNSIDNNRSFSELLQQVRDNALAAFAHQDIPFELLVDELQLPRDLAQTPLFNVMFILQAASQAQRLALPEDSNMQVEPLQDDSAHTTAKFDLTLNLIDDTQLAGVIEYRTALFSEQTIARMADHFVRLLQAIVAAPAQPLAALQFISPAEIDRLQAFNHTAFDYPPCDALHRLIEQQAAATPAAIAVCDAQQSLSYDELNAAANRLAHYLLAQGVSAGQPVAVCLERSVLMSVALLAIHKAGAAYVPFDPAFPLERLQFMAADTGARILISHSAIDLHRQIALQPLLIDQPGDWQDCDDNNPALVLDDNKLFNIIYTSGSTGQPKGVMVPQRGIINRLRWMQQQYPITAADRILQKTPYSFDVSVWELFWPLMQGATLVYAKPDGHKDPAYLRDLVIEQQISVLHFVPSMLGVFLQTAGIDRCTSLRQVFCSGEALQREHTAQFYRQLPSARLSNLYGPTEASVDVSYYDCVADEPHRSVPIGKPVHNTQLYVLDASLNRLPIGVPGDLYIGGVQLAEGYLNRAELTAATFIDNPFFGPQDPGKKLYKTGDVARYLADGNLEYLGRSDHQIKIRGLRIELGEIESRLQKMAGVREAIVMAHSADGSAASQQLVAWLLADEGSAPDSASVRRQLARELPDYMVPVHIIRLDAWPLSANGKIDRKALPKPDRGQAQQ